VLLKDDTCREVSCAQVTLVVNRINCVAIGKNVDMQIDVEIELELE
jgi:hypothetical protein